MADVSIAIVNWNGREILRDCLSSLLPQTERDVEYDLSNLTWSARADALLAELADLEKR